MYTERDLVKLAKRENNNKRKYLVVNQLQGKHIPVVPSKALLLFQELAKLVKASYPDEKLLLIGFAETATAIGAALAVYLKCDYMQTTREIIDGVEYFFFSEAHSHATEQKLVKDDMDIAIRENDRIIFVEDEVTTGNTILNIVTLLKAAYPGQMNYSIASLLNGMDEEALDNYRKNDISAHYLVKSCHDDYEEKVSYAAGDGTYYKPDPNTNKAEYQLAEYNGHLNARRLVNGGAYKEACDRLWQQLKGQFAAVVKPSRLLVLGTEEFMYPALYIAACLETCGYHVLFHATTRSPIMVSHETEYPLHARYQLTSLYDKDRTTFIYNLDSYDTVLLITDAKTPETAGINTIINALADNQNKDIRIVRWCEDAKLI